MGSLVPRGLERNAPPLSGSEEAHLQYTGRLKTAVSYGSQGEGHQQEQQIHTERNNSASLSPTSSLPACLLQPLASLLQLSSLLLVLLLKTTQNSTKKVDLQLLCNLHKYCLLNRRSLALVQWHKHRDAALKFWRRILRNYKELYFIYLHIDILNVFILSF